MTGWQSKRPMPFGMTPVFNGASPSLPLVWLTNHSTVLTVDQNTGTREIGIAMLGAFVGYLRHEVTLASGIAMNWDLDGVTVANETTDGTPLTILALPSRTQSLGGGIGSYARVGYKDEYVSDNVGLGGAQFIPQNVYEWRWSLVSGEAPQGTSNATDGVWTNIASSTLGRWFWSGTNPDSFTSQLTIDVRDGSDIIVATSTIDVERIYSP